MPNDAGYTNDTNDASNRAIAGPESIRTPEQQARLDAAGNMLREKDAVEAESLRQLDRDNEDAYAAWENKNQRLSGVLRAVGQTGLDLFVPQSVSDVALMLAGGAVLKHGARGVKWAGNKTLTGIRNMFEKKVGPDQADKAINAVVDAAKYINQFGGAKPQMRKGMAILPFKRSGKLSVVPDEPAKVLTLPAHVGDDALEMLSNNPGRVAEAITKDELKAITPMLKRYRSHRHTEELNRISDEYHALEGHIKKVEKALEGPLEASKQANYKEALPILEKEYEALGVKYLDLKSNKPRGKLTTDELEDIFRGLSSNIRSAASEGRLGDNDVVSALTLTQKAAKKMVDRSNKYNPNRPPKPASTDVEEALTILSNIARRLKK